VPAGGRTGRAVAASTGGRLDRRPARGCASSHAPWAGHHRRRLPNRGREGIPSRPPGEPAPSTGHRAPAGEHRPREHRRL